MYATLLDLGHPTLSLGERVERLDVALADMEFPAGMGPSALRAQQAMDEIEAAL